MNIHNLDSIFKPNRIAITGITPNPNSVSGKVLNNLINSHFRGVIYPVNSYSESVQGISCYPSLTNLPKTPDLAIICNPASETPEVIRQCGEAGIKGLIIMSAGFKETGSEGNTLEKRIQKEQQKFNNMRILGPNCLGFISPYNNLNASFAPGMQKKGHIAFISQSGALCSSVLDWALDEHIGFSCFVSIGNAIDIDFGDLIDYFGEDENTHSIILYIESIKSARKFMSAARAYARIKPIIVYKSGRFSESAEVVRSHTGALVSEDAIYHAAFQRSGIARVLEIGEIFDFVEMIEKNKLPAGPKLGIITNAGGPGVIAVDALMACHGTLAKLSSQTIDQLNKNLPPYWSRRNPIDVLGDARSKRMMKTIKIIHDDPGVDALLLIVSPQAMTNPTTVAKALVNQLQEVNKPVICVWLGGQCMKDGIQILKEAGVTVYKTPEQAIHAFMLLVDYARNLEDLYETPKNLLLNFPSNRQKIRDHFESLFVEAKSSLSENMTKKLLNAYAIPVTQTSLVKHVDDAVSIAEKLGYPVVLKIHSKDILHKTEVGGVALNLMNEKAVRSAYQRIISYVFEKKPNAKIEGVLVENMVNHANSTEMILGLKRDSVFGTVIMVGSGGIQSELIRDRALGFPPLNEQLAKRMLQSLKIWPLFTGFRNNPALNLYNVIEIMIRLSYLAVDFPAIKELDINPLLVTPKDVTALDANLIIDQDSIIDKGDDPYAHLALKPYPEKYVQSKTLNDGTTVILKPIKPEDEPLWFGLLKSCSRESIYSRFHHFPQWNTHNTASRYCSIDYQREMAIIAEIESEGKLIGVGRLISDPDQNTAEYAVLISDSWQNKGLGKLLTEYCVEVAKNWGIKKIIAQTTTDNHRMLAVFKKLGFQTSVDPKSSFVNISNVLV